MLLLICTKLRLLYCSSIDISYCRVDAADKNIETTLDSESNGKTARQRVRVLASSSDEDEQESNEHQVKRHHTMHSY